MNDIKPKPVTIATVIILVLLIGVALFVKNNPDIVGSFFSGFAHPEK